MKIKKSAIALSLALLVPCTALASTTTIFQISSYTYATSTHGDEETADTYYGTVSIRGADRVVIGNDVCYPVRSNLYYNVQGRLYEVHVSSQGKNDKVQRTNSITVKDLWNLGPKTTVWGNYDYNPTGDPFTDNEENF